MLQVEVVDDGVTIRTSRDTFTAQRKACFVRELASEGFIPDEYLWWATADAEGLRGGVRWIVDFSWLEISPVVTAQARRFMMRLFAGACLLLALLMGMVLAGRLGDRGAAAPGLRHHGPAGPTVAARVSG